MEYLKNNKLIIKLKNRLHESVGDQSYNLAMFLFGILFLGINQGILNSTFNNYLYDTFNLSASVRGLIEFPRELPGFLLIFVTALLAFTTTRNWAALVGLFSSIGIFGLAFLSPSVPIMILWTVIWSLGDHLFMTVESVMGIKLAKGNAIGQRLGQISGFRNLAGITGTLIVIIMMKYCNSSYVTLYTIATITAFIAGVVFWRMRDDEKTSAIKDRRFIWRKKYNLFYALNFAFGARKQLFLTFAPWLLVSVYHVTADTIAILFFIAAILGFFFRQYFGIAVDKFGEKKVLLFDALVLVVLCLVFAYSKNLYLLYAFFIIDALMFATRIARTTYLNKIIENKNELTSTLSLGVTIDHIVSMIIPFAGGLMWSYLGYKYVFLGAMLIAVFNAILALRIKYK